jgi:hypothetical protein
MLLKMPQNVKIADRVLPRMRKWAGHAQIPGAIVVLIVLVQIDALPVRRPVLSLVVATAHAPRRAHCRLVIRASPVASTVRTLRLRLGYRRRARTRRGKRCGRRLVHEFLRRAHERGAGAIAAVCVHRTHRAAWGRDGRYGRVGWEWVGESVPLRMCDESPCIELHLVGGYHEAEIVE